MYGGVFDVSNGSIFIGANTKIEPNTTIMGPTILGADCVIRAGAYIRGDAVIGNDTRFWFYTDPRDDNVVSLWP